MMIEKIRHIFDYFNSRELAIASWAIIFFLLILFIKEVRGVLLPLIKAVAAWKLQVTFLALVIYVSIIISLSSYTVLWKDISVKEIVIWGLFAGIPFISSTVINKKIAITKGILIGNIKFIVIVSFIINFYTFSYWIEMLIIPCAAIAGVLIAFTEDSEEHKPFNKFITFTMSCFGFFLLFYAIKSAITDYPNWCNLATLISFLLPVFLSAFFIPVAFILALISAYETMYIRVKLFQDECSLKELSWRKKSIFSACKLSLKRIALFEKGFTYQLYPSMTRLEFETLLNEFKVEISKLN